MNRRSLVFIISIFFVSFLIAETPLYFISKGLCYADESFGDDSEEEELESFPEVNMEEIEKEGERFVSSDFYLGGFIKQELENGFKRDDRELAKVKSILNLESSYKITPDMKFKISANSFYDFTYEIEGREKYNKSTLDDYETESSLRELYIDWNIYEQFSLKIGRQVITWGESDYTRITDIINPRDLLQPGLTNLEEARLPTTSVRLTYESENISTELVTIHESPDSSIGGYGSDFDYYSSLRSPVINIADEDKPATNVKNIGFGLRVTSLFNGGDLSLYLGKTYDDLPVLKTTNIEFTGPSLSLLALTPEYHKYKTYGITGKKAVDSILYKFELAYIDDKIIMRNDFINNITYGMNASELETFKSKDQFAALCGVEYTGINDLRITIELENIHTYDYENYLATDRNDSRAYLQSTYKLLNETMELDFFCSYFKRGKGYVARFSTNYDIIDNLNFEVGVIFYGADDSDSILYYFKNQDRLFSRMKYSF